jgi:hypothetical protein
VLLRGRNVSIQGGHCANEGKARGAIAWAIAGIASGGVEDDAGKQALPDGRSEMSKSELEAALVEAGVL